MSISCLRPTGLIKTFELRSYGQFLSLFYIITIILTYLKLSCRSVFQFSLRAGAGTFYREPEPELVKKYREPEPLNLI